MTENKSTLSKRSQSVYQELILKKRNVMVWIYFDKLDKFKSFTLSAIESEKKKEKEFIDGLVDKGEWVDGADLMVEAIFKTLSLNSFVLILYSFIEHLLNRLCNPSLFDDDNWLKAQGIRPLTRKYTDMNGKGIRRAKRYLEQVIGLNLHADEQPWDEIVTLSNIRNSIVHSGGEATDKIMKDANIKQHLENERLYIFTDNIIIGSKYLDFIIPTVREFFQSIE
ncbi:MAG: hypothetical protein H8D96_01575 [Desulfobacterales bacterium]|uniref:RiboL-PSP-HEPN domain-containing protein n=1 Tax=Candidatus Desulfatibia vada TaxID=2841696 RepID=A0A8J6NXM0_9BACT|nr:hypothetical protein [Candidatus Desulfatibia vada]